MQTDDTITRLIETDLGYVGLRTYQDVVVRTTLPELEEWTALITLLEDDEDAGEIIEVPDEFADRVAEMIRSYCDGAPVDLTGIKVEVSGISEFTRKVRELCRTIPRGEVRTYRWLAEQAGSPDASRAVGRAMATNPVPLLVPCHRVIGSNGKLTGFGGMRGIRLKKRLLEMESANP